MLAYALAVEKWAPYYNFDAIRVPINMWTKDPFLLALAKKRDFHVGLLKMNPNTCYNWHVDADRMCGINMLLSQDGLSHCLFLAGSPGVVFETHELKYEPDTYYAFNTQINHMVLNFKKPRYLLSLEFFGKDCRLTFDELCKDIEGTAV